MLICNAMGARPNFMKIAPIVHELKDRGIAQILVHTGQHYDANMSDVFFKALGLPEPDIYLGVGSDTHARQTAQVMIAFEQLCQKYQPDLVVVGGDVNSTLAVALAAAKLNIPVAHIEAGLRSFDRSMPEEINRVVTDHISELLFTTEESGNENLLWEGIPQERIHFVGNCMVDSLMKHVNVAVQYSPWKDFGLNPDGYALLTLHRPSNVDDSKMLKLLINTINQLSHRIPVLFSVHPRTRERLLGQGVEVDPSVILCEPLPYHTFLGLMSKARLVLTDSGGIQEETTILKIPCLTLRRNTERPITITRGTNELVGTNPGTILEAIDRVLNGKWKEGSEIPMWDGKASKRVVDVFQSWIKQ